MTTRLIAMIVTTALLGFLMGARAIGGPASQSGASAAAAVREWHPLRGGFWRPVGSEAERPVLSLAPVSWSPETSALE